MYYSFSRLFYPRRRANSADYITSARQNAILASVKTDSHFVCFVSALEQPTATHSAIQTGQVTAGAMVGVDGWTGE